MSKTKFSPFQNLFAYYNKLIIWLNWPASSFQQTCLMKDDNKINTPLDLVILTWSGPNWPTLKTDWPKKQINLQHVHVCINDNLW